MPRVEGIPERNPVPPLGDAGVEVESRVPRLVGIYTSPLAGAPMEFHRSILATAGIGLEGDRYATRNGAYSEAKPHKIRDITLISSAGIAEANARIVELAQEKGRTILPFVDSETRRNLVVGDLSADKLNALVGKRFWLGGIELEGIELCTPCTRPGIVRSNNSEGGMVSREDGRIFEEAFAGRGGLRARIVNGGEIHVSDVMRIPQ